MAIEFKLPEVSEGVEPSMPANAQVNDAEAKQLVQWIMTVK